MSTGTAVVWGPELSPYLLKLESLLTAAGVPFRRLPRDGSRLENAKTMLAIERAKKLRVARQPDSQARRSRGDDDLDEYPLVPYLLCNGDVLYDSSAIGYWLGEQRASPGRALVPADPALAFVTRLIDEAFDEFGLYMVHHNRWKVVADSGEPGMRFAREYSRHLPPGMSRLFAGWFERRQIRRLPYLFSVASEGSRNPAVSAALTPPSRAGFPPTHALLDEAWERHVGAIESILQQRPYLLGAHFTLADASAYGQLSMNLEDTGTARRLGEIAPNTLAWLRSIRAGRHVEASGDCELGDALAPLLEVIVATFVPLMRANEAAYHRWKTESTSVFNERAFDAGVSLYDGELLGRPFRSVAKTFQVRAWQEVCEHWASLSSAARVQVAACVPVADLEAAFAR